MGRVAFNGNFEIDELVREGGHGVGEAEGVRARGLRGEDKVSLAFFFAGQDDFVTSRGWAGHGVVDVKGAAGLDLSIVKYVSTLTV